MHKGESKKSSVKTKQADLSIYRMYVHAFRSFSRDAIVPKQCEDPDFTVLMSSQPKSSS